MFDYLQFSLLDMTPYSRSIYFDMIGLYNQTVWPAHIPAMFMALWLLYTAFRPGKYSAKGLFIILSCAWLWNGWIFHRQHYSSINWAGDVFAYLFIIQGCLLIAMGWFSKAPFWAASQTWRLYAARALLILVILMYPVAGLLEGRTLTQLELFAITPAPTVMVTFALLLLVKGRVRYGLAVIPMLWSLISVSFAWALQLLEFYAIIAVLFIWLMSLGKQR